MKTTETTMNNMPEEALQREAEKLSTPTEPSDSRAIRFHAGLYRHGYQVAREQGDELANSDTEKQLASFASSAAKCLQTSAYDPAGNSADRCLEEQRQRDLTQVKEVEHQIKHARARLREDEDDLAKHGEAPAAPAAPLLVGLLSALAVAITLAFALHDLVTVKLIHVTERALIAAGFCATVLAAAIVLGMLSSIRNTADHDKDRRWLFGSLLFSSSLLLMRLSVAKETPQYLIAFGFAGSELAILLVLDALTQGLRARRRQYEAEQKAYTAAERKVAVSMRYLDERQRELSECNRRVAAHDRQLAEREELLRTAPAIAEAAREAIILGYHHGVAANRGYLNGSKIRPPSDDEIIARLSGYRPVAASPDRSEKPSSGAPTNGHQTFTA